MNHPVLEVVETIVLLSPADEPWRRIGRFDDMSWHPAIAGLEMLDGAASDAGARRRLTTADGGQLVECLVEHDMAGRTYRYRMETSPLPLTDYDSTISVEALAKGGCRGVLALHFPRPRGDRTGRRGGARNRCRDLPCRPRCPSHGKLRSPAPRVHQYSSVATPSTANTAAAIPCTSLTGMRSASLSPISTAGRWQSSCPAWYPAPPTPPRTDIAPPAQPSPNWVLSPISARKNAITVAPNTPRRGFAASASSSLSGTSIHAAMAMKEIPRIQRRHRHR